MASLLQLLRLLRQLLRLLLRLLRRLLRRMWMLLQLKRELVGIGKHLEADSLRRRQRLQTGRG